MGPSHRGVAVVRDGFIPCSAYRYAQQKRAEQLLGVVKTLHDANYVHGVTESQMF